MHNSQQQISKLHIYLAMVWPQPKGLYSPTLYTNLWVKSQIVDQYNMSYMPAIDNGIMHRLTFLDFTRPSGHGKQLWPALSHNMRHVLGA